MYKVIVKSGAPNGELISEHETIEQAERALLEAVENDAEEIMRYGIPYWDESPAYEQAYVYAASYYLITMGE